MYLLFEEGDAKIVNKGIVLFDYQIFDHHFNHYAPHLFELDESSGQGQPGSWIEVFKGGGGKVGPGRLHGSSRCGTRGQYTI